MRGTIDGLDSPHPLGSQLPAMFLADAFAQQLCGGLDEVLAPVVATLDSWPAYLDPATAPEDALGWLAGWLGLTLDNNQPEERRRDLLAAGVELLSRRGTVLGLRDAVRAYLDLDAEISEPGGAHWSSNPGTPLPGTRGGELLVRVRVADPASVDPRRLDAVVQAVVPAHIRFRVEVVASAG
jgi:phage tail-like protein